MNLEIFALADDGVSYVESRLRQGTGLCARILQLALAKGTAFAPLPHNTTINRASSFDIGGLLSRRDAFDWLTCHVRSLWDVNSIGTFVIQDIWAKPNDVAASDLGLHRFFDDENVYYLVEESDADPQFIKNSVRATTSYQFMAFFSRVRIEYAGLSPNRRVAEEVIDSIARATEEVFVGAYDQEGFVVWRR
jgi:hypothetical protein